MANTLLQIGLIVFTVVGFLLTSLKLPDYGVIANLIGQVFWLYSSYVAWREANQVGMFVCSVLVTLILLYGIENYWLGLLPSWNVAPIVGENAPLCR